MKKKLKLAIIGGSGFWSEQSHHRHILNLKSSLPIELKAIVDFTDPKVVKRHENMQKLISLDNTAWLSPKDFIGPDAIVATLRNIHKVDLVIIASNPCTHFEYGMSCLKYSVNVICDKPIVSSYNASTSIDAASKIREQFDQLVKTYHAAKKQDPALLFHSILRRRSLEPFVYVANELGKVYQKTGAGVNNMTLLVNGGIHKLPAEFTAPGAHGYLDGIGSLAHSAYHYIDVLAWFISRAPGNAVKMVPKLNYALRVGEYLKAEGYKTLAETISVEEDALVMPELAGEVLGCELNTGFTFVVQNQDDVTLGELTFLFNHVSFTPRVNGYDSAKQEPANYKGGGRMSHIFVDVNQEGLQSWQINKNDIVFEGNNITLQGRRHPFIDGGDFETKVYENAYEPEISMEELLKHTLQHALRGEVIRGHSVIRSLEEERLATAMYASCYELIASDYQKEVLPHNSILI